MELIPGDKNAKRLDRLTGRIFGTLLVLGAIGLGFHDEAPRLGSSGRIVVFVVMAVVAVIAFAWNRRDGKGVGGAIIWSLLFSFFGVSMSVMALGGLYVAVGKLLF